MSKLDFGKYRSILVSIVLFLILDASVLILNFYISFEIADDAIGVNTAGRQRMLSQRMVKSLFDIQTSVGDEIELDRSIGELSATTKLFDITLEAFYRGGQTTAPTGEEIFLDAVSSNASVDAVSEAKELWAPYLSSINALLAISPTTTPDLFNERLNTAIQFGRSNNLSLLALMNTLTGDLEAVASSKANRLRTIQVTGISLALVNFFIIIFHSVRQLRDSDRQIAQAQNETQEILDTVNEGLFLLDKDGVIGHQYSAELERIIGREDIGGLSLNALMKNMVSEHELTTTEKYLGLLFDAKKKQTLLGSLNPLKEVEVHLNTEQGAYKSKFLSFAFSRVAQEGAIMHILVTVKDITKQVQLARELELAQKQGEQQLEMLTSLMSGNSSLMPAYLENSIRTLNRINEELRSPVKTHKKLISKANQIYALIHNFKGESAALEMEQFVDLAHQFEDEIESLKANPELSGNDFLPLTILLNKILSQIEAAQKLLEKISTFSSENQQEDLPTLSANSWDHLQQLADQVGERQNKKIEVLQSGLGDQNLPTSLYQAINNIAIQMIRNSVTHGIESLDDRLESQKPETGTIDIRLVKRASGEYQLSFSDDGAGLDLASIRSTAIERGLVSEQAAELMDKKQVISMIFSPDFSTSNTVDKDSGRGIGMAAVQQEVRQAGGKIAISSRRGLGCTFTITLPADAGQINLAA